MTKATTTNRGWLSADLPVKGDDPSLWTAADASRLLGPPVLSTDQVRQLIRMVGMVPVGKRRAGSTQARGRYARVYPADSLIRAYEALYVGGEG